MGWWSGSKGDWRGTWEPLENTQQQREWKKAGWKVWPQTKTKEDWQNRGKGKGGEWTFVKTKSAPKKQAAKASATEGAKTAESEVESEEDVALKRQKRTFLEVVLGGTPKPARSLVVKAGSRSKEEAAARVEVLKRALEALGTDAAVEGYKAQVAADLERAEVEAAKALTSRVTATQLEAKAAFIEREERRIEDLVKVIQRAQASVDTRLELLAQARADWKSMHVELLAVPQTGAVDSTAGGASDDMECTLDELERRELNLYREAAAKVEAGDDESAKRLMVGISDIQSQLKKRRLAEPNLQPSA
jgi:hypothetical protein